MISLQSLLGKDDKFLRLLEASAEEARASVRALAELLQHPERPPALEDLAKARRAEKNLALEINEHVTRTFVTALEREDIVALSDALYRIPKTVEKFAERYVICARHLQGVDFGRQLALMEQATDQVRLMVKLLHQNAHLERIKEENAKLQKLEGDADRLMLEMLRDLYSGQHPDLKVIALKELYELLEKVVDRCRDAGNVVTHIVLKHA